MKSWQLLLVGLCFALGTGAACSDDGEPRQNNGAVDEMDIGLADATSDATTKVADDGVRQDTGSDLGSDLPDLPPVPRADYTRCSRIEDCPLNTSVCVMTVALSDGSGDVALSDVFSELSAGEGVCSRDCTDDLTACDTVLWADETGSKVPSFCMVVAVGADPYPALVSDPTDSDAILDVENGQGFAAICAPPFNLTASSPASFCYSCTADADCDPSTTCINLRTDAPLVTGEQGDAVCLPSCVAAADCPIGFDCTDSYCLPVAGTCSACVDRDGDEFGTGSCRVGTGGNRLTPHDCDDRNELAYFDTNDLEHSFPMYCGDFDYNCDGLRDDEQQIGTVAYGASHCTACEDSCSGLTGSGMFLCETQTDGLPACVAGCLTGFADCNGDPADGCETDATAQDKLYYKDADMDGRGDRATETFHCDAAAAMAWAATQAVDVVQVPPNELLTDWEDCDDDDAATYPGATEMCDGRDNDCDGFGDSAPQTGAPIAGVGDTCSDATDAAGGALLGACAVGEQVCATDSSSGMPVWGLRCAQTVMPLAMEVCDGVDGDCDGSADDVDAVGVGDACGGGAGFDGSIDACAVGANACGPTGLTCVPTNPMPVDELPGFDQIDSNCDGHDRYYDAQNGRPYAIFVDGPRVGGTGTPTAPYGDGTLNAALTAAEACNVPTPSGASRRCDVFLRASTTPYGLPETLVLRDGVDIYGGFDPGGPWTDLNASTQRPCPIVGEPCAGQTKLNVADLSFENHSVTTLPQAVRDSGIVVGVLGSSIVQPTLLAHFTVKTANVDATRQNGDSNFAMALYNAGGVTLQDINLTSGSGGRGARGLDALDAANPTGAIRTYVKTDTAEYIELNPRYNSGVAGCANATNSGGAGGLSGAFWTTPSLKRGGDGTRGAGPVTGGLGGLGNSPGATTRESFNDPPGAGDGVGGGSSANSPPVAEDRWGSFSWWPVFQPNFGSDGNNGGGGGGGGGSGYAWNNSLLPSKYAATRSGSNGGCGGNGGGGGQTGGFSVALAVGGAGSVDATNLVLTAGVGGNGGAGGRGGDGSEGQAGTNFVNGQISLWTGHAGHGAGGNGGNGGAGGASIALWRIETATVVGSPTFSVAAAAAAGGDPGEIGDQGAKAVLMNKCIENASLDCTRRVAEDGLAGEMGPAGFVCQSAARPNYTDNVNATCL